MAIVRMTLEEVLEAASRLPVRPLLSDEEIERRALADEENPPMTDEELARAVAGRSVRLSRQRDGLSQPEFAARYALPLDTVVALEAGSLLPDPALAAYIGAIERDPGQVLRSLAESVR